MSLLWTPWRSSFSAGLLPEHRMWDASIFVFAQALDPLHMTLLLFCFLLLLASSKNLEHVTKFLSSSCTFFANQASSKERYCNFFRLEDRHRALGNSHQVQSLGRKLWGGILTNKTGAEQGLLRIRWPGQRAMRQRWIWVCGEWLLNKKGNREEMRCWKSRSNCLRPPLLQWMGNVVMTKNLSRNHIIQNRNMKKEHLIVPKGLL